MPGRSRIVCVGGELAYGGVVGGPMSFPEGSKVVLDEKSERGQHAGLAMMT